jgi:hypothetical protein
VKAVAGKKRKASSELTQEPATKESKVKNDKKGNKK